MVGRPRGDACVELGAYWGEADTLRAITSVLRAHRGAEGAGEGLWQGNVRSLPPGSLWRGRQHWGMGPAGSAASLTNRQGPYPLTHFSVSWVIEVQWVCVNTRATGTVGFSKR